MYVKINANTCFQIHIKQTFHKTGYTYILYLLKKHFFSDLEVSQQH